MASEGLTNRDTSRQCQQHDPSPELYNQVSNDTLPNNVLILHDSARYCVNTDHEQMSFCSSAAVFPPQSSASVFPPTTTQNLTRRPRIADLKNNTPDRLRSGQQLMPHLLGCCIQCNAITGCRTAYDRPHVIHLVCDGWYGAVRCQYIHYQVQAANGQESPHMCVRLMSTCRTQGASS